MATMPCPSDTITGMIFTLRPLYTYEAAYVAAMCMIFTLRPLYTYEAAYVAAMWQSEVIIP